MLFLFLLLLISEKLIRGWEGDLGLGADAFSEKLLDGFSGMEGDLGLGELAAGGVRAGFGVGVGLESVD